MQAKSGSERRVFKVAGAKVVIERGRIAGEIGFQDVEISVQIVIGSGDSHPGLGFAIGAECAASIHCNVLKLSVLLVHVESTGLGVIRNIDIGPAVIFKIGCEDAQSKSTYRIQNSARLG